MNDQFSYGDESAGGVRRWVKVLGIVAAVVVVLVVVMLLLGGTGGHGPRRHGMGSYSTVVGA